MLRHLAEYEAPGQFHALGTGAPLPAHPGCGPIIEQLDYLFHGQAIAAPGIMLAGGVTKDGIAVSGAGTTVASALTRLCGETAEQLAMARPLDEAPQTLPRRCRGASPATTWIVARAMAGTDTVAVPRDLCRAGLPDREGQSEGLAAGPTIGAALQHGVMERIERRAVRDWWAGHGRAVRITDAHSLIAKLGAPRERRSHLLFLPNDSGVPVFLAASFDRSGHGFCFGSAAHPDPARAARAALRELAQSEFGLQLARQRQNAASHPHEIRDLVLADRISETALVSTCPTDAPLPEHPDCADLSHIGTSLDIYVCDLGEICPGFHVVKTVGGRADTKPSLSSSGALQAIAGVDLFL